MGSAHEGSGGGKHHKSPLHEPLIEVQSRALLEGTPPPPPKPLLQHYPKACPQPQYHPPPAFPTASYCPPTDFTVRPNRFVTALSLPPERPPLQAKPWSRVSELGLSDGCRTPRGGNRQPAGTSRRANGHGMMRCGLQWGCQSAQLNKRMPTLDVSWQWDVACAPCNKAGRQRLASARWRRASHRRPRVSKPRPQK